MVVMLTHSSLGLRVRSQWITIPCEAATSAHCILSFGVEAVWANANPNVAANPVAAVIAGTFLGMQRAGTRYRSMVGPSLPACSPRSILS